MMYDDDEACGLHTIDRFACHYNKKAKSFKVLSAWDERY